VYKTKNHYNEWEFLYSPMSDMPGMGMGGGNIGTPAGGTNNNMGFGSSGNTNGNNGNNGNTGNTNSGTGGQQTPQ
jgi:hypothetical protein